MVIQKKNSLKNEAVDVLKIRGYMNYAVHVTKEETALTLMRA
jgi:hypothetical protein